jgi:hypothetical protein
VLQNSKRKTKRDCKKLRNTEPADKWCNCLLVLYHRRTAVRIRVTEALSKQWSACLLTSERRYNCVERSVGPAVLLTDSMLRVFAKDWHFLEKLPAIKELKVSLPHSQKLSTGHYRNPVKSSLHRYSLLFLRYLIAFPSCRHVGALSACLRASFCMRPALRPCDTVSARRTAICTAGPIPSSTKIPTLNFICLFVCSSLNHSVSKSGCSCQASNDSTSRGVVSSI